MGTWKVWYQPVAKFGKTYSSGTLTVEGGRAAFEGKKQSFTLDRARSVGRKPVGMTSWIEVEYEEGGETKHAYFVDKRMLGWGGMLGGNEKLAAELRQELVREAG
jgi:hypothetical protein